MFWTLSQIFFMIEFLEGFNNFIFEKNHEQVLVKTFNTNIWKYIYENVLFIFINI